MSNKTTPSKTEIKKQILDTEQISGKQQANMLDEVEHIFDAIQHTHKKEVESYQQVIQKLSNALELTQHKNRSTHSVKNSIEELRKEVIHLEESHPALVLAVENIIRIFAGLGLV